MLNIDFSHKVVMLLLGVLDPGIQRTFPLRIPATKRRSFDAREHNSRNRGHGTVRVWRMPRRGKSQWVQKWPLMATKWSTCRPRSVSLEPRLFSARRDKKRRRIEDLTEKLVPNAKWRSLTGGGFALHFEQRLAGPGDAKHHTPEQPTLAARSAPAVCPLARS